MDTEIRSIKNILLVEDDPRDVELTLAALEEHHLANKVAVVRDQRGVFDVSYFSLHSDQVGLFGN